jgi:hypothetical protein
VKAINSKIILSGVLSVVLLSGCASISTVPKSEEEMNALGDDSLLHVPVDISNFPWKKVQFETVVDENFGRSGLKGQTTIFPIQLPARRMMKMDSQSMKKANVF